MSDWNERETRIAVANRSGGICEVCQRARATEMHHRHSRGTGGKWSPANILHLCHRSHADATLNRSAAYARGTCLRRCDDANTTPVVRDDGTSFQPSDDALKGRAL